MYHSENSKLSDAQKLLLKLAAYHIWLCALSRYSPVKFHDWFMVAGNSPEILLFGVSMVKIISFGSTRCGSAPQVAVHVWWVRLTRSRRASEEVEHFRTVLVGLGADTSGATFDVDIGTVKAYEPVQRDGITRDNGDSVAFFSQETTRNSQAFIVQAGVKKIYTTAAPVLDPEPRPIPRQNVSNVIHHHWEGNSPAMTATVLFAVLKRDRDEKSRER
ncbi:hypothetical protein F5146DRAFT_1006670 [Armillaria mellea]|nr:hypothetical protein F5146DRAFT_1006670 [Armillaria mellea]